MYVSMAGSSPNDKAQSFIQVLIISVTVVVVAVPEGASHFIGFFSPQTFPPNRGLDSLTGLPLAVTLALAFATRRMTKMKLLVRVLSSCETMANATVVCTDKTGTLTQNQMTVVAGSIGVHLKFAEALAENADRVAKEEEDAKDMGQDAGSNSSPLDAGSGSSPVGPKITISPTAEDVAARRLDFSVDQRALNSALSPALIKLLNESIALNSTVFEQVDTKALIGSKTETALIGLAQQQEWPDFRGLRASAEIVQMIPFSSERKAMGVLVRLSGGPSRYRLYVKGASEVLTKLTTDYVVVREERPEEGGEEIETSEFGPETRSNINRTIMCYANQSLRTIALCYRDFDTWPGRARSPLRLDAEAAEETEDERQDEISYEELVAQGLTLLAVVAIEDPLRAGVTEAVASCLQAGVGVKMVTGDNVLTAK